MGINTDTPLSILDIRGADNVESGGELQLATPSQTDFLRLFGGRLGDRNAMKGFRSPEPAPEKALENLFVKA